jgi:hypothetical protein
MLWKKAIPAKQRNEKRIYGNYTRSLRDAENL